MNKAGTQYDPIMRIGGGIGGVPPNMWLGVPPHIFDPNTHLNIFVKKISNRQYLEARWTIFLSENLTCRNISMSAALV